MMGTQTRLRSAGPFVRVSTLSCNKCSRDSAVYRINLRVRLSTVRRQRARMDKRPLLNLHPALYPFPHGLGRERCLVRVNDPFERSHLAQSRSSKLFFDTSSPKHRGRGNVSSVRVCRGTRCASIHRAAGHLRRLRLGGVLGPRFVCRRRGSLGILAK